MGDDMDEYLMQEFDSIEAAQACLAAINAVAQNYWQSQGYSVQDGALIGKNAASGEDEPMAARTVAWAQIEDMDGGKFGFYSPGNAPRFALWKGRLAEIGFTDTGRDVLVGARDDDI